MSDQPVTGAQPLLPVVEPRKSKKRLIAGVMIIVMVIVIAVGVGIQYAPFPAVKSTIHNLVIHRVISATVLGTPIAYTNVTTLARDITYTSGSATTFKLVQAIPSNMNILPQITSIQVNTAGFAIATTSPPLPIVLTPGSETAFSFTVSTPSTHYDGDLDITIVIKVG